MWTSLVCAVSLMSLAPSQADTLSISNARFIYNPLGMERPNKFLPPDGLVLAFDINNLSTDKKTGKVVYGVLLEFNNEKGKRVFTQNNKNIEELNALGGSRLSTFASGLIGRDTTPG